MPVPVRHTHSWVFFGEYFVFWKWIFCQKCAWEYLLPSYGFSIYFLNDTFEKQLLTLMRPNLFSFLSPAIWCGGRWVCVTDLMSILLPLVSKRLHAWLRMSETCLHCFLVIRLRGGSLSSPTYLSVPMDITTNDNNFLVVHAWIDIGPFTQGILAWDASNDMCSLI